MRLRLYSLPMLLLILLSPARLPAEDAQAKEPETSWDVIFLNGQRIGYVQTKTHRLKDGRGNTVVRTDSDTHMTITRFGQKLIIHTTMETDATPEGDILRFKYIARNPPAGTTTSEGVIKGDKAELTTTSNGTTSRQQLAWDRDVKAPSYQDDLLASTKLKAGQELKFKTFLPDFNKITEVIIQVEEIEEVPLLHDEKAKLRKVKVIQDVLPGQVKITTDAWINDQGHALKTDTLVIGAKMLTYRVDQEEALKEISGAEVDLAIDTLVKVKRIENAHSSRQITYKVTIPGVEAADTLPAGGTQLVKKLSEDTVELTVKSLPIPETAEAGEAAEEYLKATRFLQSDDEALQKHVTEAVGEEQDAAKIARLLERYVYRKLSKKNFSTALASAGEVARNLEGDCTEHAVFLAAMLRAKKIPSRIVVGMVYVNSLSAFGGHMWCEAKLGDEWVPLDATLGQGGIGSAHIKLAQSSFADESPTPGSVFLPLMNVIGNMKIEILQVSQPE